MVLSRCDTNIHTYVCMHARVLEKKRHSDYIGTPVHTHSTKTYVHARTLPLYIT
jgi:hypothetical protein